MSRTIARIVGTRPQIMQVPPVLQALTAAGFEHVLVHTGQHYDAGMSDVFFRELGLPDPDVNLEVGSHTQGKATGLMLERIETWLLERRPDAVLIDGDTNSTMAGALAAAKLHLPVFHVEAGLRDWDRRRPEEINRCVTDHVADRNFAPIPLAFENLRNEGLEAGARLTGDVLCDCFVENRSRADLSVARSLGLSAGEFGVLTLHRPENTDFSERTRFDEIMAALKSLDMPIVFPVHPRTRAIVDAYERDCGLGRIVRVEPVSYLKMLGLISEAAGVFTDSGGVPREAVWSGKRCVMLFRMDTWHSLLERGWAGIGKTDARSILDAWSTIAPPPAQHAIDYYGGGRAAPAIADHVQAYFE